MRRVLSLVAVGFVLQAVGAQGQSPAYDASVTPNDTLAAALWRIAKSTNTRIGFEATDHTRISLERIPAQPVSTLEEALNAAVGADDRYEWRRVHDVVVVRPKDAWDDPSDPLNRQMRNVQVENQTVIRASWTSRLHLHRQIRGSKTLNGDAGLFSRSVGHRHRRAQRTDGRRRSRVLGRVVSANRTPGRPFSSGISLWKSSTATT